MTRRHMNPLALLLFALALRAAQPAPEPVTALAFSPDGAWLVSGGYNQALVWNGATGKLDRKIAGQLISMPSYAFKHPPIQVPDSQARQWTEDWIADKRER